MGKIGAPDLNTKQNKHTPARFETILMLQNLTFLFEWTWEKHVHLRRGIYIARTYFRSIIFIHITSTNINIKQSSLTGKFSVDYPQILFETLNCLYIA